MGVSEGGSMTDSNFLMRGVLSFIYSLKLFETKLLSLPQKITNYSLTFPY